MLSVRIALAVGLALAATAVGVVLSGSPLQVAGTNSVPAHTDVSGAPGGSTGCQPSGSVPAGTSALRISASSNSGPSVRLKLFSGSTLIAHGSHDSGWGVDESVTLPVKRVPRSTSSTKLCITFGPSVEPIQINGALGKETLVHGQPLRAVMFRVEYMRPGPRSWWSLVSSVAHRMGLGHAAAGTWVVFLVIALMITVAALASRLILRPER